MGCVASPQGSHPHRRLTSGRQVPTRAVIGQAIAVLLLLSGAAGCVFGGARSGIIVDNRDLQPYVLAVLAPGSGQWHDLPPTTRAWAFQEPDAVVVTVVLMDSSCRPLDSFEVSLGIRIKGVVVANGRFAEVADSPAPTESLGTLSHPRLECGGGRTETSSHRRR